MEEVVSTPNLSINITLNEGNVWRTVSVNLDRDNSSNEELIDRALTTLREELERVVG